MDVDGKTVANTSVAKQRSYSLWLGSGEDNEDLSKSYAAVHRREFTT